MTRPRIFLTRMIIFLVVVVGVGAAVFSGLFDAFLANPALNGLILGVLILGVVYIFRQVIMLYPEVSWIETFRESQQSLAAHKPPRLLAPMAMMLRERRGRVSLSAIAMRTLVDGIGSRLDESRDISRYLIGLLIFLGLLGTFWGLLQTVSSVGEVVRGLSVRGADMISVFDDLKTGLEAPLGGMGTAFSSSLFGLAGSLVLGFLELQAAQAQNRFYNDLEEWLSSYTRLSTGTALGEGEQSVPAYVNALLEQTAESLEELQRTLARGEESRMKANTNAAALTDRLATLTDQMRAEQNLMVKLVESQMEIRPVLERLAEVSAQAPPVLDEASRVHLRNLDVYASRLLEETVTGRNQVISELRSEIKLLARTIAAIAEEERR